MKQSTAGWGSGLLGVVIFSGSLPATRVAVADFSPMFLTSARAAIAALLGAVFLVVLRQPWPERRDILPLALVAVGGGAAAYEIDPVNKRAFIHVERLPRADSGKLPRAALDQLYAQRQPKGPRP